MAKKDDWLKEYLEQITEGVKRIEGKQDDHAKRISKLENWRTRAVTIASFVGGGVAWAANAAWEYITRT